MKCQNCQKWNLSLNSRNEQQGPAWRAVVKPHPPNCGGSSAVSIPHDWKWPKTMRGHTSHISLWTTQIYISIHSDSHILGPSFKTAVSCIYQHCKAWKSAFRFTISVTDSLTGTSGDSFSCAKCKNSHFNRICPWILIYFYLFYTGAFLWLFSIWIWLFIYVSVNIFLGGNLHFCLHF